MEGYIAPAVFCISIGIFLWLQGLDERVVPYRESLVSKDFYPRPISDEKNIVWILRSYTVESRLHRMIQYIHTQYGISQVVIIPNRSKISPGSQVPILEFFQKTEIAWALNRSTQIFCEAGVMKTAAITAAASKRPLGIFLHDSDKKEIRSVLELGASLKFFYTSQTIQDEFREFAIPSFQFYLPVFVKEHVTHSTRQKIVCSGESGARWKFQEIARTLPNYTFFYSSQPNFKEAAVLCMYDSPYELGIKAAASDIPIVCQWSPLYEEVFQDYCIYVRKESEWLAAISRLQEDALFYREWSLKARRLSQLYDSPKEMDMFLNYVFSGNLISQQ